MRRIILSTAVAALALVVIPIVQFDLDHTSVVVAHPGPHPPSPPTYDYDTVTFGTQPPTSPWLAGAEAHHLWTLRLNFNVFVPLAELQAILPAGFTATETAHGSGLAAVFLYFNLQERIERVGLGTFGPGSSLSVGCLAGNMALNRLENLYLAVSTPTHRPHAPSTPSSGPAAVDWRMSKRRLGKKAASCR